MCLVYCPADFVLGIKAVSRIPVSNTAQSLCWTFLTLELSTWLADETALKDFWEIQGGLYQKSKLPVQC